MWSLMDKKFVKVNRKFFCIELKLESQTTTHIFFVY